MSATVDPASFTRRDIELRSRGEPLAAWLYMPAPTAARPPIILMAHGFAAERSFKLPDYAERFAAAGMAVLLFDFRSLGDSGGEPRRWVSHRRQLADWQAAIDAVRTFEEVDADRIALWGTSYSGGQVIIAAARNPQIAAVVSQVPMVDVPGSMGKFGLSFTVKALGHALWDLVSGAIGRPHYVPVIGPPGTFAVMQQPGCVEGYLSNVPSNSSWRNECRGRVLMSSLGFRAVSYAPRVRCPVQLIISERDQLIPKRTVERTAARLKDCELIRLDADHFAPYHGELFEQMVARQTAFFAQHLGVSQARARQTEAAARG